MQIERNLQAPEAKRCLLGVLYHDENFWLTQKALAGLFNVKVPAISKHLKNIFEPDELDEDSVVSILEIVNREAS